MAFVNLQVYSQYSLLRSCIRVKKLPKAVKALGQDVAVLADDSNLFGMVKFLDAAKDAGVRPVVGATINVQPEGVAYADPLGVEGGYKLTALVENEAGYKNLCALLTSAMLEGMHFKPRVDLVALAQHSEGLVFVTDGVYGPLRRAKMHGMTRGEARNRLRELADAVGKNRLYLSLCDVGSGFDVNDEVRKLAAEFGLKTVVVNPARYVSAEEAPIVEVLTAIALGKTVDDPDRPKASTDQMYLKTEAEVREVFPGDADAVDRTVEVAERCKYEPKLGGYKFPAVHPPKDGVAPENWEYMYRMFPPPKVWGMPEEPPPATKGCDLVEYFRWYARRGLKARMNGKVPDEYAARLVHELEIIEQMGFPVYMLVVAEFVNWAKDAGIDVGPARGSAAGSLVSWAMRITEIDPVPFDLIFERFLNPARVSMPDIDVDFCQARRGEVIDHVREKYGDDHVVQIVTYGGMKARGAIKDVGRALGMFRGDLDEIAGMVPEKPVDMTIEQAMEGDPVLREKFDRDPRVRRLLTLAMAVEGLPKSLGVHAAGVVISDRPVVEHMPLYRPSPTDPVVGHFDMKAVEESGLIKFDFLGLKTLDQMRETCVQVEANHGKKLDVVGLAFDDAKTMRILREGDTKGLFQVESSGMRELIVRLAPSLFEDLIALVALYRPGPLKSGMVDEFVMRKHGAVEVKFYQPVLEEALRPTYGTIVYQEQVMRIAQDMAGYSGGAADLLRRAMGKKIQEEMDEQRVPFVKGCVENGYDEAAAGEMFDLLAVFAGYGFNKAHSAAYAAIAYQTAWLKAHYRPEFMAALMTSEAAKAGKVNMYIADARKDGILIGSPCVQTSRSGFTALPPVGEKPRMIRYGLEAIKNVGVNAVASIVEEREALGRPYRSLVEFLLYVSARSVTKRVVEFLAMSGALDCFGVDRHAVVASSAALMDWRRVAKKKITAKNRDTLLPGLVGEWEAEGLPLVKVKPYTPGERMAAEAEALGTHVSEHPLGRFAKELKRFTTCPLRMVEKLADGEAVRVAGLPSWVKKHRTKTGKMMAFARIEDGVTEIEIVLFPEAWAGSRKALEDGEPVIVFGKVQKRGARTQIIAARVRSFKGWCYQHASKVYVMAPPGFDDAMREKLEQALVPFKSGQCQVFVVLKDAVTSQLKPEPMKGVLVSPNASLEIVLEEVLGTHGVLVLQ